MSSFRILIADDEPGVRFVLRQFLEERGYLIEEAEDGQHALKRLASKPFDLLLLDLKMPKLDGFGVLKQLQEIDQQLIVIVITAYGSQKTALEAIKLGAYDYFVKPFQFNELEVVLRRALEKYQLLRRIRSLQDKLQESANFFDIIGSTEGMQNVFELIQKVSQTDVTVMVFGESGTGKELVAEAIHGNSPRKDKPFIKVSCVSIPETLLESELFGHERGAFTGAFQSKPGKFELAHGGTIFLDEIGDMPHSLQAKLLRVLQDRTFERLGGTEILKADVRIIAATNKDLQQAVAEGAFREDLYFRVNVIPISIPPLRHRRSDIPLLCDHFVRLYNERLDLTIKGISHDALQLLCNYNWPGNVRELENTIQRAMVLCPGEYLTCDALPLPLEATMAEGLWDRKLIEDTSLSLPEKLQLLQDKLEKEIIRTALQKEKYHRQRTAQLLGISRKSLHNKMVKYQLFEKD